MYNDSLKYLIVASMRCFARHILCRQCLAKMNHCAFSVVRLSLLNMLGWECADYPVVGALMIRRAGNNSELYKLDEPTLGMNPGWQKQNF